MCLQTRLSSPELIRQFNVDDCTYATVCASRVGRIGSPYGVVKRKRKKTCQKRRCGLRREIGCRKGHYGPLRRSSDMNTTEPERSEEWVVRGRIIDLGPAALSQSPWMMGIVNATPDSFSDGGAFLETAAAVDRALLLVGEGAQIIDVGGESTRPGAQPVGIDEELRRVVPVVTRLAQQSDVCISVDTTKAVVARAALEAGAHVVNDISGLMFDPEMPHVCAKSGAGVICMHIRGTPQTMAGLHRPFEKTFSQETSGASSRRATLRDGGSFGRGGVARGPDYPRARCRRDPRRHFGLSGRIE
jgi:hypothetical protein